MILITGATGNIGRALARDLAGRGVPFRALVRDPRRASLLPTAADVVVADLAEPATLPAAFVGAERLFLLTQGIGTALAANALTAASDAGVRHVVLLSSTNVLGDPMPAMGHWHHAREELVRSSGIPATILRPTGFMTNAFDWLPTIRTDGFVHDPIGPGRQAVIDTADIAAVAARVLTEEGHDGTTYTLTGGEALTVTEMVAALADATGTAITTREPVDTADVVRFRFPDGAPPPLAEAFLEGIALLRTDRTGLRTDTVRQLLGRPPRTFADWCVEHADTFRDGRVTAAAGHDS